MLLEIDVVRRRADPGPANPDAVLVFVDTPSPRCRSERLRARGDTEETIAKRLAKAAEEAGPWPGTLGAHIVVNDDLDRAVARRWQRG